MPCHKSNDYSMVNYWLYEKDIKKQGCLTNGSQASLFFRTTKS